MVLSFKEVITDRAKRNSNQLKFAIFPAAYSDLVIYMIWKPYKVIGPWIFSNNLYESWQKMKRGAKRIF